MGEKPTVGTMETAVHKEVKKVGKRDREIVGEKSID